MSRLGAKFRHWLGRPARVRRLEEEMATHIDLLTEEGVRSGLARAEARRRAHLAFGNVLATREETQEALGWPRLEAWSHDVRIAVRGLRRRPAFALSLILVLALGIGVTVAVFSLVRGVLFAPLPVPAAAELQLVRDPKGAPFLLSQPALRRLEAAPALAGGVAGYSGTTGAILRLDNAPAQPCTVQFVTGGFFGALQVPAAAGRALGPADDAPGAPAAAVASFRFSRDKLGGPSAALGRTLRLNGQAVVVVGVAPAEFAGVALGESPELWLPLSQRAPLRSQPSVWTISDGPVALNTWDQRDNVLWLSALVRLPAGAPGGAAALEAGWRPQLDAALAIVNDAQSVDEFRRNVPHLEPSPQGYSEVRDDFRRVGLTLGLLVGAVVLVTAANVATLLLLRVLGRGRELGVRLALGAGRARLARAVLLEGVLLALAGAAAGALLALWLTPVLAAWLVPGAADGLRGPDGPLLGALAGGAVLLGLVMGAAPAWWSASLAPQAILQQRVGGAGGSLRLGRTLIVAQLALSVLLIAIAGALALDLHRVLGRDPGYERRQVVEAFFNLGSANIPRERHAAVLEEIRAAATALPQVSAVGFAASGPLSGSRSRSGLYFRGEGVRPPADNVQHESVDAGYFRALGLTLLRGRALTETDDAAHPLVAVISARLAREVFGDANPIGRRFGFDANASDEDREIVGVVADAGVNGVREAPPAMFYLPLTQWESRPSCLLVRVAGDPAAAREALRQRVTAAQPALLFTRWATLEERAQRWVDHDRAAVRLTAGFGILATLLAVVGVLGALGYLVASRSRDLAVRMAIGADPAAVWRGVVRDALVLGVAGAGLGVGLALLLPRFVGSWLMTGLAIDPVALGAAAVAGVLAALLGGLLPARRAAKVDPLTLLKAE